MRFEAVSLLKRVATDAVARPLLADLASVAAPAVAERPCWLPLVRNTLYIPRLLGGVPYRAYMRSYIWGFSYMNAYMWPISTVQDCPDAIRTVRNDSSACNAQSGSPGAQESGSPDWAGPGPAGPGRVVGGLGRGCLGRGGG